MEANSTWKQNSKIRECFDSLPKSIQETIMQSGADFNSAEELKNCAQNFLGKTKAE